METMRVVLIATSFAALSVAIGCDSHGIPTVPVQGKVTFAGGAPPSSGSIVFNPLSVEEGLPRRPGRAQFDEQGNFRVTSFHEHDGLIPGRYQPVISCWKGMPSSDDLSSYERLNYVPKDYQPPELDVQRGQRQVEVEYDVPPKKAT